MAQAVLTFAGRAEQTIAAAAIALGASVTLFNAACTCGRARRFHASGVIIAAVSVLYAVAGSIIINAALQNATIRVTVTRFLAYSTRAALINGNYLPVAHFVQVRALEITVLVIVELKERKKERRGEWE